MTEAVEFTSPEVGCVPGMDKAGVSGQFLARRANSFSTASRMNCARLPGPARSSIRAIIASDKRTCVALIPNAGLPMREGVTDTVISDKPIPPIDTVSDTGFISGITYGDKAVTPYTPYVPVITRFGDTAMVRIVQLVDDRSRMVTVEEYETLSRGATASARKSIARLRAGQ